MIFDVFTTPYPPGSIILFVSTTAAYLFSFSKRRLEVFIQLLIQEKQKSKKSGRDEEIYLLTFVPCSQICLSLFPTVMSCQDTISYLTNDSVPDGLYARFPLILPRTVSLYPLVLGITDHDRHQWHPQL